MKTTVLWIAAACGLWLTGCGASTYTPSANSWIGRPASDLIDACGPPRQVFNDGSGGRVMSWSPIPIEPGDLSYRFGDPVPPPPFTSDTYWINANGTIYRRE